VARARDLPGFDCDEPLRLFATRVIEIRANEVFEHSEGVLDLDDIEPVHDMRVATRRLRAALEVFQACLPKKERRRALRRVKALADALGERRDRDVQVEFLENFAEQAPEEDRASVAALIAELRIERQHANEELAHLLTEERLRKLRRRLASLAAAEAR
jgi:CHAD domain-containing protein